MPETMQIITFIIGSVVVIFGAYFTTYLVANGSKKVYKGRAIQVLDRFSLTKDKYIVVLAVYDKVYLVAFSAGAITLLDNLDPALVKEMAEKNTAAPFSGAQGLAAAINRLIRKSPLKKAPSTETNIPFELYLQQDQAENGTASAENRDNLNIVYAMMKNRQGKEDQRDAFADNAYFEEDLLK